VAGFFYSPCYFLARLLPGPRDHKSGAGLVAWVCSCCFWVARLALEAPTRAAVAVFLFAVLFPCQAIARAMGSQVWRWPGGLGVFVLLLGCPPGPASSHSGSWSPGAPGMALFIKTCLRNPIRNVPHDFLAFGAASLALEAPTRAATVAESTVTESTVTESTAPRSRKPRSRNPWSRWPRSRNPQSR
jgi:hypothetical protein